MRSWPGGKARRDKRLGTGLFCVAVLLCPLLLAQVDSEEEESDGTVLARLYALQVTPQLDLPKEEQLFYGELLADNLSTLVGNRAEYAMIVDRNKFVQAAMIYWMSPDGEFHFIGASPVSTGKPGKFEHFVTPIGVFEHTIANPDFRAEGTFNEFGIRGYGRRGMRVFDFGWQIAWRGWNGGGEGTLRLQMHATDPDRLEQRLGTRQSEGCIRIPTTLNVFIDHYGILDGEYERAMARGRNFWVLSADREPTPWSGRFLVVVDSRRKAKPAWSLPTPP